MRHVLLFVLGAAHGGLLFVVCGFWGCFVLVCLIPCFGVGWGYVCFSGLCTDCCSGLASMFCCVKLGWGIGFVWRFDIKAQGSENAGVPYASRKHEVLLLV